MSLSKWMAWEGGVDLVAVTKEGLEMPNVIVHVGRIETSHAVRPELKSDWQALLNTFVVTNTSDSGAGSLRQAIIDANAVAGLDEIRFNIGAPLVGGAHTISLNSALPEITDSVIIDGTTDSDHVNRPIIELDGSSAGLGANGLVIGVGQRR